MIQLFKGVVPNVFAPTPWITVVGGELALAFQLVTSGGPTSFDYYLEFTDDPTAKPVAAARETDEQDVGFGVVSQSKVIRTFREEGGALLSNASHGLSAQFRRMPPFARLQIRVSAGNATATITSSNGQLPVAPS